VITLAFTRRIAGNRPFIPIKPKPAQAA